MVNFFRILYDMRGIYPAVEKAMSSGADKVNSDENAPLMWNI